MHTRMVAVICALVLVISLFGCKGRSADQESATPLKVGMELAYPPFETKDNQGNPFGISVDLAYALGEYLERPVSIINTNWDGLIPSLQTGKVDVVISSMTITEERKGVVDFSIPYAKSHLALLANLQSNIESVNDLNREGAIVAVRRGTTGHMYALEHLQKATINTLASENACVIEVTQGKADAFIYDQLTIYRQQLSNKDTTKAILIPFQQSESWGMAVKKGNSALLQHIDEFIAQFIAKEGFNDLTQKHLAEEKKVFDALQFPWFFD